MPLHNLRPGDRVKVINDGVDGEVWRYRRNVRDRARGIVHGATETVQGLVGRYLITLKGKPHLYGSGRFRKVEQ